MCMCMLHVHRFSLAERCAQVFARRPSRLVCHSVAILPAFGILNTFLHQASKRSMGPRLPRLSPPAIPKKRPRRLPQPKEVAEVVPQVVPQARYHRLRGYNPVDPSPTVEKVSEKVEKAKAAEAEAAEAAAFPAGAGEESAQNPESIAAGAALLAAQKRKDEWDEWVQVTTVRLKRFLSDSEHGRKKERKQWKF